MLGHSSGGYGALVMGRYHPELFSHLGSHAGDCYFEYCYLPDLPKAASALLKAGRGGGLVPGLQEALA